MNRDDIALELLKVILSSSHWREDIAAGVWRPVDFAFGLADQMLAARAEHQTTDLRRAGRDPGGGR